MKAFFMGLLLFPAVSFASIYTKNLWKHNEVTVCFAEGEEGNRDNDGYVLKVRTWKEAHKQKVRQWIAEEYTAERTGIHFSGFEDCADNPNSDIVVFYNKNSKFLTYILGGIHGLGVMGPYPGSVHGYPGASGWISISASGVQKGVVVHEFGHAAGLHHEHIHPDAYAIEKNRCREVEERQTTLWNFVYEPYDRESVMNYCRLFESGGSKRGLSVKNVELLKRLYP